MADAGVETPDLKQDVGSPGHKRKRGSIDQSPGDRRAKRGAPVPAANMVASTDASSLSFLETAAAEGGVGVDLSALQQANEAANHTTDSSHQPVGTDASNASSTAAAALGSMYPTLHVPSTTEQQFVQAAAAEGAASQEGAFGDVGHVTQHDPAHSPATSMSPGTGPVLGPNGTQPPQGQPPSQQHAHHPQAPGVQSPSQQVEERADYQYRKPPVGSDEWHKLRKDNHKEGLSCPRSAAPGFTMVY